MQDGEIVQLAKIYLKYDKIVLKDVFPIIFGVRGLTPDMLRFPCVCVMTFTLGL